MCNLLFVISTYLLPLKLNNTSIFFIALLPTGPAICALFSFMYKLNNGKEIRSTVDYFRDYARNFKSSMKLWLIVLSIETILTIDLIICIKNNKFLILVLPMALMLTFTIITGVYAMAISCRYEISLKHNLKLSIYMMFKKPIASLINVVIVVSWIRLLSIGNIFITLFISSGAMYLIAKNLSRVYMLIDEKYLE